MSPISKSDWGRAIGVSHSNIIELVRGDSCMQTGPAMQRLIRLFDALDSGRVKWVKRPPRKRSGRPYHEIEGPERFTPVTTMFRVDFTSGRIRMGRESEHEISA